jgi:hypothetical protein
MNVRSPFLLMSSLLLVAGCAGAGRSSAPASAPPAGLIMAAGSIGDTCTTDADCVSGQCDRTFPGGYCTTACSDEDPCPVGNLCREGYCLQRCTSAGDCRSSDYACYAADAEGTAGVCGFDTSLLPTAPNTGAPCTAALECAGPDGTEANCIVELTGSGASTGFAGGMCVAMGCQSDEHCGTGATCVPGRIALCMPECTASTDCRDGYTCDTAVRACVPAATP